MEGFNTTDELCTVCQPDGSLSLTNPPNCTGKLFHQISENDNGHSFGYNSSC